MPLLAETMSSCYGTGKPYDLPIIVGPSEQLTTARWDLYHGAGKSTISASVGEYTTMLKGLEGSERLVS